MTTAGTIQVSNQKHVIIVGAGIGGLATALRLLASGASVAVYEAGDAPGGKMRTTPSDAGPVDAGPTVLTMRWVFDDLFSAAGEALSDHVTLTQNDTLARHFWSDGTKLDLFNDTDKSRAEISRVLGPKSADEFTTFTNRAERLFEAFDAPMMRSAAPSTAAMARVVLSDPGLIKDMAPLSSLAGMLRNTFSAPKLRQLFGRYATYVGGSPYASPALLSLIWHAERSGVWAVEGGMHQLARAIAELIKTKGGVIHYGTPVDEMCADGVIIRGQHHAADSVVFNGDPRALVTGRLGDFARKAVARSTVEPRSLSANVMSFAAIPCGVELSHHNVFFGDDPKDEFVPISEGRYPTDPTLYVCAQDRGGGETPTGLERFEIIMNAPPCGDDSTPNRMDSELCQRQILSRLQTMGLTFEPTPTSNALTQPAQFHQLFPGSLGSLYGRSPHGMTAGLKRPRARTAIKGLYLAGGGAHPGAGVPMATLSGMHAAEAICTDLGLTSTSHQMATRGGTSTGSARMAPVPSRSSPS